MRNLNVWSDLLVGLLILALGVLLTLAGPATSGTVRLVVAFVALLFVPGYAAAAALFPNPRDTDLVSRMALTLGLSVAAVPLVALLLNVTPWGITPASTAVALLLLSVVLSGVAVARRLRAAVPEPHGLLRNRYARRLVLAFAAVMAASLLVGSVTSQLRAQGSYTEFYALGDEGRLERYPRGVLPGQLFTVKLGVLNRERTSARYAVQSSSCAPLVNVPKLSPGQEWRGDLQCRAIQGSGKVEFILYREGSSSPYRSLSLNLQPAP